MTRPATYLVSFAAATFAVSLVRAVANLAKALQHRREIMHLSEFDDRMLKDIGLCRSDVEGALAESLLANPSLVLVRRVARHPRSERLAAQTPRRPVVPMVKSAVRSA